MENKNKEVELMNAQELQKQIKNFVLERDALRVQYFNRSRRREGKSFPPMPRHMDSSRRFPVGKSLTPNSAENRKRGAPDDITRSLPEYQTEKRPKAEVDEPTKNRTQKMFGHFLGHLQRAKTDFEKEKETRRARAHQNTENEVEQVLDLQKRNLDELRKMDFAEKKKSDLERYKRILDDIVSLENRLLKANLETHYKHMGNFIRTTAEPPIFWIPAVHTEASEQLRSATQSQIERKIAALKFEGSENEA